MLRCGKEFFFKKRGKRMTGLVPRFCPECGGKVSEGVTTGTCSKCYRRYGGPWA